MFSVNEIMGSTKYDNNSYRQSDLGNCLQTPFDVNGLALLLCTNGRAVLGIDFKDRAFVKGDLALVPDGISLIPRRTSSQFSVQILSIEQDNLMLLDYKINNAGFWDYLYQNPILHPSERQYDLLEKWFEQMHWILDNCHTAYRGEIISNNILSLFIAIHSEIYDSIAKSEDAVLDNHALQLMSRFWTYLSRHHIRHRKVNYYANLLSITPDYLNKLCKAYWKVEAKESINTQVMTAIKNYLTCTDLSVKNIAAMLNFEDPSYMCRFFRKMTGMSPIEFRNKTNV